MFKTVLTTLAATLISTVAIASSLQEVADSTFKLYNGNQFSCSAVAVSENQLVTAAHCIPKSNELRKDVALWIEKYDRTQLLHREVITVNTLRINYDEDTAFLKVRGDRKFSTFVDIAVDYSPVIGDDMYAIGYPRGGELTLTEGMFTSKASLEKELNVKGDFWKTTVPVTGSSSGGGFYIRENVDGKWNYSLIGLTSATYRDVGFQTYISTLDSLNRVTRGYLTSLEEEEEETNPLAEEK